MTAMAMFPLGMALLPGGVLPLHVFEPRYRQLVTDCMAPGGSAEFGQTLITHGSEAGGGDVRAMIGTAAQMVQVEAIDDERYGLVAVGTRRIRVRQWLPDDPYPRAEVEDWPDAVPAADLTAEIAAARQRVTDVLALAAELGDVEALATEPDVAADPVAASYHLAALSPIGPADRYRLLSAEGPADRLDVLSAVLDDVEAMLKFRLT